jgi:hypothetical protein
VKVISIVEDVAASGMSNMNYGKIIIIIFISFTYYTNRIGLSIAMFVNSYK